MCLGPYESLDMTGHLVGSMEPLLTQESFFCKCILAEVWVGPPFAIDQRTLMLPLPSKRREDLNKPCQITLTLLITKRFVSFWYTVGFHS